MFFLIPLDMQTLRVCIRVDHETPSGGPDSSRMRVALSVVLEHRPAVCTGGQGRSEGVHSEADDRQVQWMVSGIHRKW